LIQIAAFNTAVTPDYCSAKFVLHCDSKGGWVIWRSIWSCCQFSYGCIWACQRQTRSITLLAPNDLVRCAPRSATTIITNYSMLWVHKSLSVTQPTGAHGKPTTMHNWTLQLIWH